MKPTSSDMLPQAEINAFFQRIERTEKRLKSVLEIGRALAMTVDPKELFPKIMEQVTLLMGAERSTLYLADNRALELISDVLQGEDKREFRIPFGQGLAGWVAQTGKSVNLADAYEDERFDPSFDRMTGYLTKSLLTIPFHNQVGVLMGVMQILNKRGGGPFDDEDEATLRAICSQAAIFLENADLYNELWSKNIELEHANDELARSKQTLDILYEIEQEISHATSFGELLSKPLQKTVKLLQCSQGSVFLFDRKASTFRCVETTCEDTQKNLFQFRFGEGLVGKLALKKEAFMSGNVQKEAGFLPELKPYHEKVVSMLLVPLLHEGETFGLIELINSRKPGKFDEEDKRLFEQVAWSFGRAIRIESKRSEREKNNRLATIGQLLSELAHDLKGPLTVIQGYAQMLPGQESPERRGQMTDKILKQVGRISEMTGEVLSFARGDSNVFIRSVKLNNFVKEIEELLAQEFAGRDISIKIDAKFKGEAFFDEMKIHRLVYNLSRNAHQAMVDGGDYKVTIDADEAENLLHFSFEDSGEGIPIELQPRIFESFVKGDPNKGTGLGLAIVQKIVEEHRGKIWFDSVPHEGTTFYVSIPLNPEK